MYRGGKQITFKAWWSKSDKILKKPNKKLGGDAVSIVKNVGLIFLALGGGGLSK